MRKIWRKGRLRGSGRDGRMYGTRAYVYATSSHYRTRPSRLPPLSTPLLSSVRCLLLIISSLFTTPFFLREFSPSRIDILLTSGQLVEFQSSGHWNWSNSSRVGTGTGGIPVEWALELYWSNSSRVDTGTGGIPVPTRLEFHQFQCPLDWNSTSSSAHSTGIPPVPDTRTHTRVPVSNTAHRGATLRSAPRGPTET